MAIIKQGLGCDFDRLHEIVNEHKTIHLFLGHVDIWDEYIYNYQTIVDNVSLVSAEFLAEVNALIVEVGHEVGGKKVGEPLRGRCDSFAVETNVHYPTDVNLLWDAMRCLIRTTVKRRRAWSFRLAPMEVSDADSKEFVLQCLSDSPCQFGASRCISGAL